MERSISIAQLLTSLEIDYLTKYESTDELIIELDLIAKPGAKLEKVSIDSQSRLNISVNTVAEDGKANKAIIKSLAKAFGLAKSNIELVRGQKSKMKTMAIRFVFNNNKDSSFYCERIKKGLT